MRAKIARSPRLYPYLARGRRVWLATPESDIVIDGFPRSANTFSVHAFRMMNPDATIAHHTHAPAQVLRAVQLGLPTIVLLRRPRGAVISEVIREPRKTLGRTLRDWLSFYDTVSPVAGSFVLGEFDTITSDYGAVIEAVNERFGTSFRPFRNDADLDSAAFDSIEQGARARGKTGLRLESQVPKPSDTREALKDALDAELDRPELQRLLSEANERYASLARAAGGAPGDAQHG
jgi:hypothetical protein